jgi:hypothetical protein
MLIVVRITQQQMSNKNVLKTKRYQGKGGSEMLELSEWRLFFGCCCWLFWYEAPNFF